MEKELSDRQRGLLTLLLEKINWHGEMMGATKNRNWVTQSHYDFSPGSEKPQGTLDRIGKAIYHKSFLTDDNKHDFFTPAYLGPDLYRHTIRFEWRELFGKGWGPNPPECMLTPHCSLLKDAVGNWHSPCDTGIWVSLWHPSEQKFQEKVHGQWLRKDKSPSPHWRPSYNYTSDEVTEALKIMCAEFDWAYEEGENMETIIFRHRHVEERDSAHEADGISETSSSSGVQGP